MPTHSLRTSPVILPRLLVTFVLLVAIAPRSFMLHGAFASVRAAATADDKNVRVVLAIEGMHCTGCASGIKALLKRTPGIISADVSYERREADVTYDRSRISEEKIIEVIGKLGYKASVKKRAEA